MKVFLIKVFVICLVAAICGSGVGVLFSLWFYGLIPDDQWAARVYLSDTEAKMRFRFWAAFALGAVVGTIWAYRMVRRLDFTEPKHDVPQGRSQGG